MFSPHLFRIFISEKSPPKLNEKCRLDDSHSIPSPTSAASGQMPPVCPPSDYAPAVTVLTFASAKFERLPTTLKSHLCFAELNGLIFFFRVRLTVTLSDILKTLSVINPIVKLKLQRYFQEGNNAVQNNRARCNCERCFKLWVC